ncbi:unnamed protein product [Musa banksii]
MMCTDHGSISVMMMNRRRRGWLWRWRWRRRRRWWPCDAAIGVAVFRLRQEGHALLRRPLVRPVRDAVLPVVVASDLQALRRLPAEVVVGVGEVLQPGQVADAAWDLPRQLVVRHVQLLQLPHPPDALRQRPHQVVVAHVEHPQLVQPPDLRRYACSEAGVQDHQLPQGLVHVGYALGEAPGDLVVGQHQDRHRGVADVVWYGEGELVVVDEQSIQLEVEDAGRDVAAEPVVADVEELERRQLEDDRGERSLELVVADVQLVEQLQALEGGRQGAVELVGVEVEEGEVGEEAELFGESPLDGAVVEVDAGDGELVGVVEGGRAVHAGVVAHVRAAPVLGEALGIRGDGVLPCLQSHVGLLEPGVGRGIVFRGRREEGKTQEEEA